MVIIEHVVLEAYLEMGNGMKVLNMNMVKPQYYFEENQKSPQSGEHKVPPKRPKCRCTWTPPVKTYRNLESLRKLFVYWNQVVENCEIVSKIEDTARWWHLIEKSKTQMRSKTMALRATWCYAVLKSSAPLTWQAQPSRAPASNNLKITERTLRCEWPTSKSCA